MSRPNRTRTSRTPANTSLSASEQRNPDRRTSTVGVLSRPVTNMLTTRQLSSMLTAVSETTKYEVLARRLDELCDDAMLDGCMENAGDLGYEYGTSTFWFEVYCQMEGLVNL